MKPEEQSHTPADVGRCVSCGTGFAKPTRFFLAGRLPVCDGCWPNPVHAARVEAPPHTRHV